MYPLFFWVRPDGSTVKQHVRALIISLLARKIVSKLPKMSNYFFRIWQEEEFGRKCVNWRGRRKWVVEGVCLNKVTLAPCLMCRRLSERNITLLSPPRVYFSMLPHWATPTCTPTHMDPQPARTNTGIKRRTVWKRGKTHLINLPGTFHSTAVCFTSKFTFPWRWKWLIPKRPLENAKCSTSPSSNNLHSDLFSELFHAHCVDLVS